MTPKKAHSHLNAKMTNRFYPLFASFLSYMSLKSFIFFIFLFSQSAYATTRVAIVSEPKTPVEDLIVAKLSAEKDIELLERSEISKTLLEQKISATGIEETQILSLGKILKTDLFAVIQSDEKNIPIGLIVFDAETGVRYWDSAFPETDMDKIAKFAADSIKIAVEKRKKSSEGKLKYLSLLSVRNADLPREKDPFCNAVGILLMRQLGNSPDIAVLERSYLEHLNKERNLPGMELQNKLIASTLLLQLEISRGTDGKDLKAIISLPDKQKLSIESTDDNSINLANALTAIFGQMIKISSQTMKPDATKEANRFHSEYRILKGHEKWFEAHEIISAAYGLAPDLFREEYAESLLDCAIETLENDGHHIFGTPTPSPEALEKALNLMEYYFYSYYLPARNKGKPDWPPFNIFTFRDHLENIKNTGQYKSDLWARSEKLILVLRKQREKELTDKLNYDVKNLSPEKAYRERILHTYHIVDLNSKTSVLNLFNEHLPLVYSWLEFTQDFILKNGLPSHSKIVYDLETDTGKNLLFDLAMIAIQNASVLDSGDQNKLLDVFKKMKAHPAPSFRIYAEASILILGKTSSRKDNNPISISKDELLDFMEKGKKELRALTPQTDNKYERALCYDAILRILSRLPADIEAKNNAEQNMMDFMLDQNKIHLCEKKELLPNNKIASPWTSAKLCHPGPLLNIFATEDQLFAVTPVKKSTGLWHLELIKAPISNPDKFTPISKTEMDCYDSDDKGEIEAGNAYARSCISSNHIFTGTNGKGLIVFPLNGEKPYAMNSLPSKYIQSCAWHDGKLYIALGAEGKESFIVMYDISSGSINTLASSQRNEKTSPFDNTDHPYYIRYIMPDAKNDRIIFLIDFNGIYPLPQGLNDMQGIWEFNLKSSQWKQIMKIPYSCMQARPYGNCLLIFKSRSFCASLNIETDENTLLLAGEHAQDLKTLLNSAKSLDVSNLPSGPYALINNEVWTASPFSKISLLSGKMEILPHPNGNKGFKAWNFILLDNGKKILAVNLNDLWLLEMKEGEL